jgi:hypothetical protein
MVTERLGQAGEHADTQCTPTRTDVPAGHIVQLAAEPKDIIRVARRVATEWREHEPLAAPLEQLGAEVLLERPQLRAQRGVRQAQLARGGGEPSLSGDHREVVQVVIVEPLHGFHVACIDTYCQRFVFCDERVATSARAGRPARGV